jgi:hypothetical protein
MSHVVTQRSNSKRAPYPYDLYLGMTKLMLEPASDGNLVAQRSKTLDATAPVDYTYSSANPFKERTFEWTKLYGGYGQIIEHDQTPAGMSMPSTWTRRSTGPCSKAPSSTARRRLRP